MDLTGNYKLKKPGQNDSYNIQNENDNMDIIDQNMKRIEDSAGGIKLDAANVAFTSSIAEFAQKNVKAALDYLFQLANNGKQYWVDVVGWPLVITDTFSTLKARTQAIKNTIATNIVSKGVSANGTDALATLADAISRITIEGMGGKRFARGTFYVSAASPYVTLNCGFNPSVFTALEKNSYRRIVIVQNYFSKAIQLADFIAIPPSMNISGSFVNMDFTSFYNNFSSESGMVFDWIAFQ